MRLIHARKWGDNPSPFYRRINWPVVIGLAMAMVIINAFI